MRRWLAFTRLYTLHSAFSHFQWGRLHDGEMRKESCPRVEGRFPCADTS